MNSMASRIRITEVGSSWLRQLFGRFFCTSYNFKTSPTWHICTGFINLTSKK